MIFFRWKKIEIYQRFRDFAEIWDLHCFSKEIIHANIAVGSSSEQPELLFDFNEFMNNKSLSWIKSVRNFLILKDSTEKH